jgi:hypothetical protein
MPEPQHLLAQAAARGHARGAAAVYEAATDEALLPPYESPMDDEPARRRGKLLAVGLVAVVVVVVGAGLVLAKVDETGTADTPVSATSGPSTPQPTGTTVQSPETVTSLAPVLTKCEDLSQPWTGSVGVEVNQQTRTLWLTWENFEQAWVSLDDLDCASQPGLRQFVESEIAYQAALEQQDESRLSR